MRAVSVLLLALAAVAVVEATRSPAVVTIDSGAIVGVADTEKNARYWKGVPFAATTGGENRWREPQPVQPWGNNALNCSDFGPGCLQTHHNPDVPTVQSEDCLNLNVYTPLNANENSDLAVMIFLHGGAFLEGSNQGPFDIYDGSYMAQSGNVVVVTSNYRLGVLGCLVTDSLKGNFALQDQRAALQWVQRNIAVFGGNATRVTLWGESAGAMSVGLHLISPLSKGLFQRVIMESNPVGLLYKDLASANDYGQYFCELLNCQLDASHCNTTCIRQADDKDLLKAWEKSSNSVVVYILANLDHLIDGFLEYTPVVDGVEVPMEPIKAMDSGAWNKEVEMIVGSNRNEAVTFVYDALPPEFPVVLYELGMEVIWGEKNGKAIVQHYQNASITNGMNYTCEVLTDYLFACSSERFAVAVANQGNGKVWEYRYDHVFSGGWIFPKFGLPAECANLTCHAAELPFVFHSTVISNPKLNVTFTPAEVVLSQSFVDYWTSFAKTGDPNCATQPNWPAFDATNRQTLIMNLDMSVQSTAPLCTFWDEIGSCPAVATATATATTTAPAPVLSKKQAAYYADAEAFMAPNTPSNTQPPHRSRRLLPDKIGRAKHRMSYSSAAATANSSATTAAATSAPYVPAGYRPFSATSAGASVAATPSALAAKKQPQNLSNEQIVHRIASMCELELTDSVFDALMRMIANDVPPSNIIELMQKLKQLKISSAGASTAAAAQK